MKNTSKKGISLLVLIITIIVMIILVSTIIISYNSIKVSTQKKEFAKEIYTVQKLVEQYNFKNNKYPVKDMKTISLDNVSDEAKIQFSNEVEYDSGIISLHEIDLYEAGVESLNRGVKKDLNENDIYVVSESSGNVFYLKGELINSKVYYTLTDDLKKEIGLSKK